MSLLNRIYTLVMGCQHPSYLPAVEKEATMEVVDDDFTNVDYHLVCRGCGELVTIKHAKLTHGVSGFLISSK
jgi:hypothetical protein